MIKRLALHRLVRQAFRNSFESGRLSDKKVNQAVIELKSQPKETAIAALIEYTRLVKYELKKSHLIIESVLPLDSGKISQTIKNMQNKHQINTSENTINPSLLAGLRIQIGDYLYENSVASRIQKIGETIRG